MAIYASNALLLEDEPLIAMDVELMLRAAGFNVTTVMSCAEANDWLDRHCPDVVIVDIELRDGACTEVATRLVAAKVPFVVHSGAHHLSHAKTPFAQGTWVGKPADPRELVDAVKAMVGGRKRAPRLRASTINLDVMTPCA